MMAPIVSFGQLIQFWKYFTEDKCFYGMLFLKNPSEMTSIPTTSNVSIHLMEEAAYQVIAFILELVRCCSRMMILDFHFKLFETPFQMILVQFAKQLAAIILFLIYEFILNA